jgi:hypothetical protein
VNFEGADMRADASERQGHSMSERSSEAQKQETPRNQLVRANFEAYRDLKWADAIEPRLKGHDLNSDEMKAYRDEWNAFVEKRDWDWWRHETRRSSNEELKAEIAECMDEIKALGARHVVRDRATTGGSTLHDIINRAGDGERIAPEPMLTPSKGRDM